MEKINLVELLKDCPKGMELDCLLFSDPVTYDGLDDDVYPIKILTQNNALFYLTKEGYLYTIPNSKCIIFPKGKTTWEGFHRPFEDGDIIYTKHKLGTEFISIFQIEYERDICTYWDINLSTNKLIGNLHEGNAFKVFIEKDKVKEQRFATEEEKERLFRAIKDNGYQWNAETKTLEKLVKLEFEIDDWVVFNNHPEKGSIYQVKDTHNYEYTLQHILGGSMPIPFSKVDMLKLWTIDDAKNGDVLVDKDNNIGIFQKIEGIYWYSYIYLGCDGKLRGFSIGGSHKQTDVHPATKKQRDLLFQKIKEAGYCWNDKTKTLEKLIIPKFKGGDKIRSKNKKDECFYILHVDEDKHKYVLNIKGYCLEFKDQDHYELVSDTSIEPKFKVGDKVRHKNNHNVVVTITNIEEDYYACGTNKAFWFTEQNDYELVPNKFDITTLKPFDNCKYSLDGGITWKYAQYWFIQEKYNTNDISIELWQG